jgi:hypothetical protein
MLSLQVVRPVVERQVVVELPEDWSDKLIVLVSIPSTISCENRENKPDAPP